MLPGFRFLLAAILLSMSILIFGLGAAALLRAAHEEVASVPTRRVMAEPVFAQPVERPAPTLALLRVEPATPDPAPAAAPVLEPAPEAVPVPKVETEKLAALKLDDVAPAEPAKPELAASEPAAPQPAAIDQAPSAETKIAAVAGSPAPAATEAAAPPFEPVAPPALIDPGIAPMKTAALGSSAARIEKPAETKKSAEKPDRSEIKKQERAERAKERRRQAARRARLAAQQAAVQQTADPFSQSVQQAQPAATTTRRR
jgi:hypothetical protein